MDKIYNVNGHTYHKTWRPGPKPLGLVSVHAEIPPEHLAALKARNAECGGLLPVNEQIRRAVRLYLTDGLIRCTPVG